jgi:hypothetical protein
MKEAILKIVTDSLYVMGWRNFFSWDVPIISPMWATLCFQQRILWSEEVALLLAVWFIFISLGLGIKQKLTLVINLVPRDKIPLWSTKASIFSPKSS